jgi:hypothetical protein
MIKVIRGHMGRMDIFFSSTLSHRKNESSYSFPAQMLLEVLVEIQDFYHHRLIKSPLSY